MKIALNMAEVFSLIFAVNPVRVVIDQNHFTRILINIVFAELTEPKANSN